MAPVIVGIAIWGGEKSIGTAFGPHKVNQSVKSYPDLKPKNDICSKLKINIQCTLTELSATDYVTRRTYHNLSGIPVCGEAGSKENARFLKWAATNAIPGGSYFFLDITSNTSAIINLGDTQVYVLKKYPRLMTDDIACGGGANFNVTESIDLDNNPPKTTYFCGDNSCSRPRITLRKGDNVEIMINTAVSHSVIVWSGQTDIIVNGHLIVLNLGTHESAPLPQPIICSPSAAGTWEPCFRPSKSSA